MRTGTPGFVGARLREVREVRQLPQMALAEMAGVSPQAISNYERDQSSPSPETLSRIIDVLNVPPHFLTLPARNSTGRKIFYRSMSSATKGARDRAEHRTGWLNDIADYASEFVELPRVNIPDFDVPVDPLQLASDDIEHIAAEARAHWNMRDQPIGDVVSLLENQGIVVGRDRLGAVTLDSLSGMSEEAQHPVVLIGTDKGTPVRWRFDGAHELGHLILHKNLDERRPRNLAEHKEIETQAHRFAAAFLLPSDSFSEELYAATLDAMLAMKPRWRTSVGMMITRAKQTNMISEAVEKRLWINYSRRGWRRREPLDDSMHHERPNVLRKSLELILQAGAQSVQDVIDGTGLPPSDIEALAGLKPGFLSDGFVQVELRRESEWPSNVTPIRRFAQP